MIYQAVARYIPRTIQAFAAEQTTNRIDPDEQCAYHTIDCVKVWFHEYVDGRVTLWYTRVETWAEHALGPTATYWLHGQISAASAHSWLIQNFEEF